MSSEKMSIKKIALLAGLSTATVSRVLNNKGNYSKEAEEKVMQVVKKYNYVPNLMARALKTNVSTMIGIIVPYITCEFFARIVMRLQSRFFDLGYSIMIYNTNRDREMERQYVKALQSQRIGGMVNLSGNLLSEQYDMSVPTVFLDGVPDHFEAMENCAQVVGDNEEGGYKAGGILAAAGCRRIGIILPYLVRSTHSGRFEGYKRALEENGMEVQQSLVYYLDPSASDQSYLEMLKWLRSNGADGLFSTSDALTLGIVKAAQEMGLRIPEDMKLIGYDVNSMFEYVYPSISTIVQPVEEMCDLTVELLCSMMEGKCPSENCFCLPVEAVCRRSTE